jgi:hypothetical protein
VFVRNYHQGDRWLPGVIEQKTGPVSFRVKLNDGRTRRCHQDQVRNRSVNMPSESNTESDSTVPTTVPTEPTPVSTESPATTDPGTNTEGDTSSETPPELTDSAVEQSSNNSAKSYPKRSRNPVQRYEPTW